MHLLIATLLYGVAPTDLVSFEARVLLNPAVAFREMAQERSGGRWVLVRRPLLLAFTIGCAVSLLASGRLSVRLITDGAVSFAFVPVFEAAALAVVYQSGPRRIRFTQAVDLFFAGNAPWLLLAIALGAFFSVLAPTEIPRWWTAPPRMWVVDGAFVPVMLWSAYIDFHFFREAMGRPSGRAVRDVILQRAIAWSCAIAYFFGIAIWPWIVARSGV
jgi:hypothetical protein